ncbi:MAG: chemotaxis protein CheW, partial [Candidatus Binatia bacterium]
SQVIDLPPNEILTPPAFGTWIKADYLHGMAKADKKFFLILDIDKVLTAEELSGHGVINGSRTQTLTGKELPH